MRRQAVEKRPSNGRLLLVLLGLALFLLPAGRAWVWAHPDLAVLGGIAIGLLWIFRFRGKSYRSQRRASRKNARGGFSVPRSMTGVLTCGVCGHKQLVSFGARVKTGRCSKCGSPFFGHVHQGRVVGGQAGQGKRPRPAFRRLL
jgi:hypothetical protein